MGARPGGCGDVGRGCSIADDESLLIGDGRGTGGDAVTPTLAGPMLALRAGAARAAAADGCGGPATRTALLRRRMIGADPDGIGVIKRDGWRAAGGTGLTATRAAVVGNGDRGALSGACRAPRARNRN